jgi:hypothetical protein
MSHLFRLNFVTNHVNGLVETGRVLLLAESHEQAFDLLCAHLNLPSSRTRVIEGLKLKPSFYTVETHQEYPTTKVSMRTAHDPTRPPLVSHRYHIAVDVSNVKGVSETQVLRKVAEELHARGTHSRLRHGLQMSINCEEIGESERAAGMGTLEAIEFYRPASKPLQGGRVGRK